MKLYINKSVKISLILICTFILNTFGQSNSTLISKSQENEIINSLSEDHNFIHLLEKTAIFAMSIAEDKSYIEQQQPIQSGLEYLRSTYPVLSSLSENKLESILSLASEKFANNSVDGVETKGFNKNCMSFCAKQWRKCAKLGWWDYVFVGCIVVGVAGIIAAAILTEGALLATITEQLTWLRNVCSTAVGSSVVGREAGCFVQYEQCIAKCD